MKISIMSHYETRLIMRHSVFRALPVRSFRNYDFTYVSNRDSIAGKQPLSSNELTDETTIL